MVVDRDWGAQEAEGSTVGDDPEGLETGVCQEDSQRPSHSLAGAGSREGPTHS